MRICFFGIYDPAYSRNAILLAGLREAGAEVIECQEDWRDPQRYRKLWKKLRALRGKYDFIYAAYPSPVPTIMAKLASRKPVVSDAFYSMFDSVVNDRRKSSRWGFWALKLLILDWLGVLLADAVVTDTEQHKRYWSMWWLVRARKIHTVYLGMNDKLFYPAAPQGVKKEGILVHFHGTYIPLQGACKIVEAAHLLASRKDIRFRLIGNGRELPLAKNLAAEYGLDSSIEFIERNVPLQDLNGYLAEADIVLGVFGDRGKTGRVIPNKVYEGLAARKAVVTMGTPAVREIFSGEDMLLVAGDPQSIADAILKLAGDGKLRADLAEHGYNTVVRYKPAPIAGSLIRILADHR